MSSETRILVAPYVLEKVLIRFFEKDKNRDWSYENLYDELRLFLIGNEVKGLMRQYKANTFISTTIEQKLEGFSVRALQSAFALKDGHSTGAKSKMLLLLCFYGCKEPWSKVEKKASNYKLKYILLNKYIIKKRVDAIIENPSIQNATINSALLGNIELITSNMFSNVNLKSTEEENLRLDFHTSFSCRPDFIKKCLGAEIYTPPPVITPMNVNGEYIDVNIKDFILSTGNKPILIKILGTGGIGKTILMWHYMKLFCEDHTVIYINKLHADIKTDLYNYLSNIPISSPVLFFIDPLISSSNDELELLAEFLSRFNSYHQTFLFLSARKSLYENMEIKKDFESGFSTYELFFNNTTIRSNIFESLDNCLQLSKYLTFEKYNETKNNFKLSDNKSLTDSIIELLAQAKKTINFNINYKFPWEEWDTLCENKKSFKKIFRVIAFYYQYGVSVPIQYLAEYFDKDKDYIQDCRRLIPPERFSAPIYRWKDKFGTELLCLQSERIGAWYFKLVENEETADEILIKLLENINSRYSAYLFRNLFRKNRDFAYTSHYSKTSAAEKLKIITKYLTTIEEVDYGTEEHKMLMEQHYAYLHLEDTGSAIKSLERSIELSERKNIFSITRLAFFLIPSDSKRAFELFEDALIQDPTNRKALQGKYLLLYTKDSIGFKELEAKLFQIAYDYPSFSGNLLRFIDYHFQDFFPSTVNHLKDLSRVQPAFSLEIIDLLTRKAEYKISMELLNSQIQIFRQHPIYIKNKLLSILVNNWQKKAVYPVNKIKLAANLLTQYTDEEKKQLSYYFIRNKVEYYSRNTLAIEDWKQLCDKILDTNASMKLFFDTLNFCKQITRRNTSVPVSKKLQLLHQCIEAINKRLLLITSDELPYWLKLVMLNEHILKIVNYDAFESSQFNIDINTIDNNFHKFTNKCLEELNRRLKFIGGDSFYTFLVNDEDIKNYKYLCNLFYRYYTRKIKSIDKYNEMNTSDVIKLQTKAYLILSKGVIYDKKDTKLVFNFIEFLIDFQDQDKLENEIYKLDLVDYKNEDQIRIYNLLKNRGQYNLARSLRIKFKITTPN